MTYFSLCGCKLEILFLKACFEVLTTTHPPPHMNRRSPPPSLPSIFTHTVKYKTEHDLAVIAVAFLVCSEESWFQSDRLASLTRKDLRNHEHRRRAVVLAATIR